MWLCDLYLGALTVVDGLLQRSVYAVGRIAALDCYHWTACYAATDNIAVPLMQCYRYVQAAVWSYWPLEARQMHCRAWQPLLAPNTSIV